MLDRWLTFADDALFTLLADHRQTTTAEHTLSNEERDLSARLMRINHLGEVCAQGLYSGAKILARTDKIYRFMLQSQQEEIDHLQLCSTRLDELEASGSLLSPFFYVGSCALGLLSSSYSDELALSFVVETEHQVEAHLADHLQQLPERDIVSARILAQMKTDEAEHANHAENLGGTPLSLPWQTFMTVGANLMKTTAYYL